MVLPCLHWSTGDIQRLDEFWQAPFLTAKRFIIYSQDISLSKCFFVLLVPQCTYKFVSEDTKTGQFF